MQVKTDKYYSPAEYLELETAAEYRSEYINGEIIPMSGGSANHNQISLNLSSALNFALRGQPYRVFINDMRLWILNYRLYTYPDIMVVGSPLEFVENRRDTITNPIIIAEVLSNSTEKYDRGEKFKRYRTIPSFKEYLLISQNAIQVEVFTKNDENKWLLSEYEGADSILRLNELQFQISLSEIYDKVELNLNDEKDYDS